MGLIFAVCRSILLHAACGGGSRIRTLGPASRDRALNRCIHLISHPRKSRPVLVPRREAHGFSVILDSAIGTKPRRGTRSLSPSSSSGESDEPPNPAPPNINKASSNRSRRRGYGAAGSAPERSLQTTVDRPRPAWQKSGSGAGGAKFYLCKR